MQRFFHPFFKPYINTNNVTSIKTKTFPFRSANGQAVTDKTRQKMANRNE